MSALPVVSIASDGELVVRGLLGEGGMGAVHLATQRSLGRDVALKVPRDERDAAALVREATTLGLLEHPNIPPVHMLVRNERGVPVLAMKRIEGSCWADVLTHETLERQIEILEAVCRALHFAHQKGIVHRDVKPENVMLGQHGEILLVDWGIAWSLGQPSVALAGTPAYMAPEMATGETPTPQTDVYLVGATLYEILTGAPPHEGDDLGEALEHARQGRLARPIPSTAPPHLAAICSKALSREPSSRHPTVEALRLELVSFRRRLAVQTIALAASDRARALDVLRGETLDDAGRERARALFREARFGFDQALAREDDATLRAERDAAIATMAEIEIGAKSSAVAEALIAELSVVPPALEASLAALKDAEATEAARLRGLTVEHDASLGSRKRMAVIAAFGIVWAIVSVLIGHNIRDDRIANVLVGVVVPILAAATVVALARVVRPASTLVNRSIVAAVFIACLFMLWSRVYVIWVLHRPLVTAISNDLVGFAAICSVTAVTLDRRLFFATTMLLALAMVGVVAAPLAPFLVATAALVLATNVVFIGRRPRS